MHPGFIDTPLTQAQAPALNEAVIASTPMKRSGKPIEVAYGCLFLARDESSYVTGPVATNAPLRAPEIRGDARQRA